MLGLLPWAARLTPSSFPSRGGYGGPGALLPGTVSVPLRTEQNTFASSGAIGRRVAFQAAWAEGQAMTLEQAIAYALEDAPEATERTSISA